MLRLYTYVFFLTKEKSNPAFVCDSFNKLFIIVSR